MGYLGDVLLEVRPGVELFAAQVAAELDLLMHDPEGTVHFYIKGS